MLKVALKGIRAHLGRVFTTAVAVLLGIAFVAGTLVLSDTILKVFDDLFADVNEGTDAVVRAQSEIESDFGEALRGRVDQSVYTTVVATEGVAEAEGFVQGIARIVGTDGEPVGNPGQGAPTLGMSWNEVDELNPWELVDGSAPVGPDQVVIDKATADDQGFEVGDEVQVITKSSDTYELVGITRFGTADSPGGATVALFDLPTAQERIAEPGKFDAILVVADEGVGQEQLAGTLEFNLEAFGNEDATGIEVLTGAELTEENQSDIEEGLSFFTTALLVFAVVALVVGGFVIYNTFGIIVAQRTREMALLRAVGAGRGQVVGAVLIEAVAIGLIGSVLGLLAGIALAGGLRAMLNGFGLDIPTASLVVQPDTIVWSLALGLVVTLVAAVFPAIRASRVPPLAAMRDVAVDTSGRSRVRVLLGLLLLAIGVLLIVQGLFADAGASSAGLGAGLVFFGVTVLGPILAAPVTRVLGAPLARFRGMTGRLARENAMRNPKRTAATASALMIGVGLVGFITIFADSAKASIDQVIDESFTGDFVLDSGTFGIGGIPPQLADDLNELPEVDVATGIRFGFAQVVTEGDGLLGVDPDTAFDILDIGIDQGSAEGLDEDGIGVLDTTAEDLGWEVGDRIPVTFADTGPQELEIALTYTEGDLTAPATLVLGREAYDANFADAFDFQVYVLANDDFTNDEVREAIETAAADYPNAEVQDLEEFKDAFAAQVNQFLVIIYALLALAIVIALFGIANTLALSIIERHRELGLLRAVGMTRSQLKSSIRWESVLIAVFGTLVGLVISVFFGWVLVQALEEEGFTTFAIPIGQLVTVVVLAALAGVGAAVLPARRAAKLDVLEAIFDE